MATDSLHTRSPSAGGAASPADQAVRLDHVSKVFGRPGAQQTVLDDINLTVGPGEFVCLLGASGCGKSTLLNLVAGLDQPSSGSIRVPGGRAALMFQEHALFPWLTAGKNIELALRLRGVPRADRRAETERLLELVRLGGSYHKRVHELSGGMRQRVALARALSQASPVLLMDEPFAALDAITRDVLHEELTRIWAASAEPTADGGAVARPGTGRPPVGPVDSPAADRPSESATAATPAAPGRTGDPVTGSADAHRRMSIIFVTHNVREAVRLAERVVLMSSRPGRIAREWRIDIDQPRRIEDVAVADLSIEITEHLRGEIRRHGQH